MYLGVPYSVLVPLYPGCNLLHPKYLIWQKDSIEMSFLKIVHKVLEIIVVSTCKRSAFTEKEIFSKIKKKGGKINIL